VQATEAILDGRFRLVRQVGRGGFGSVWEAEAVDAPGKRIAIKVMDRRMDLDEFEARFFREVKNAQRLDHPHAVKVLEHGRLLDGRYWYTMELCPGRSLRTILNEDGPLAPARAVALGRQALEALGAAHAMGMVHRDVKPENVQITAGPDGREYAKVLDFGLAKIGGGRASQDISATGQVSGTVRYMAPEQLHGDDLDGRADIYAMAATLYEMIVGRPPFDAKTEWSLIRQVVSEDPPDAAKVAGERVSGPLGAALGRALNKRPAERYPDADAFSKALLEAVPEATKADARPPARESLFQAFKHADAGGTEVSLSNRFFDPPPPLSATREEAPTPLGGRYTLVRKVSDGRRGPRLEAIDVETRHTVAVKLLESERAASEEERRRWLEGLRALTAVAHPNVVRVLGGGLTPSGVPYVVEEWTPGPTLDRIVDRHGKLSVAEAAAALAQVLDGLGAAHALGVLHRDLGKRRILAASDAGAVLLKLFGFRAATSVVSAGGASSRTGAQLGSARYMSPEQLRGEPLDARSDLFAAGVLLFELLAGRSPWSGERQMDVMKPILFGPTPGLPDDIPAEARAAIGPVVARALARKREERFATAAEMRAALAPLASPLSPQRFAPG
jgi:serine/threonine protein kinase